MADKTAITDKIQAIAERVAADRGLEIVDAQLLGGGAHRLLRIFIDKIPGIDKLVGVSHADCEYVSQHVGTILDVEDVIPGGRYTLEVSSPGVERKLARPREFERFVGHKVKVTLREPVDNKRHWVGALSGFTAGIITLEPAPGKSIQFPLEQVEKANLKFEW